MWMDLFGHESNNIGRNIESWMIQIDVEFENCSSGDQILLQSEKLNSRERQLREQSLSYHLKGEEEEGERVVLQNLTPI